MGRSLSATAWIWSRSPRSRVPPTAPLRTKTSRSQTINLAETIYTHVSALPADLQRETFDFIGFLEARYGLAPATPRLTTQGFIERFAGSLGADFPDDVDAADLGRDVPRESLE